MAFLKCRFLKNFIFTCSKYKNEKAPLNLPKLVACWNQLDDCFFFFLKNHLLVLYVEYLTKFFICKTFFLNDNKNNKMP